MCDKNTRTIYYVANIGTGKVSVIDGESFRIITEIDIGSRPMNIIVDDNKNIYIASDRDGKIILIKDLYAPDKTWNAPNNGNIQVDLERRLVYISNTDEVSIYSLNRGEKITSIVGLSGADSIKLDRHGKRLFILDMLENEVKVYDTLELQLINSFKGVSTGMNFMCLSNDERYVYISSKVGVNSRKTSMVSILELETGNITSIDLQRGSTPTVIEQSGKLLYVVNGGLDRIDILDLIDKKCIGIIKTTLPIIRKIRLSPDGKILLATSQSINGAGVLDRIDTKSKIILNTLEFENYSFPTEIALVAEEISQAIPETFTSSEQQINSNKINGTSILAKKIISTYQEKLIIPDVTVLLSLKDQNKYTFKKIIFEQVKMIAETINKEQIEEREDYVVLQYSFFNPYHIELLDEQSATTVINGRIDGKQKIVLYFPEYALKQGAIYNVSSFTDLLNSPVLVEGKLKFGVKILISTMLLIEDSIFVPNCENCPVQQAKEHREEGG